MPPAASTARGRFALRVHCRRWRAREQPSKVSARRRRVEARYREQLAREFELPQKNPSGGLVIADKACNGPPQKSHSDSWKGGRLMIPTTTINPRAERPSQTR